MDLGASEAPSPQALGLDAFKSDAAEAAPAAEEAAADAKA
jgi:hypothetical protein